MSILSPLFWKLAAGAAFLALCAGLWMRGEHYAARARTSEALLKSAIAVGNANAELARTQAAQLKRIDAVATVNALKKRDLRVESDTRRKAIIHAPVDSDGPLAPVLRDQLDRLPKPPSADPRHDLARAGDSVVAPASQ